MYKSILVHVDASPHMAHRVTIAADLAAGMDSRLVGTALLGADASLPRERAELSLGRFEEIARHRGVGMVERRYIEEDTDVGLCMESRYSDLVVVSQAASEAGPVEIPSSDSPQDVVLNSARPVLVLPPTCKGISADSSITIAWNGSNEAARAITSALPLLQRARQVNLVVFDAEEEPDAHGELPGVDMANYLAQHGVRAEISNLKAGRYESDSLVAFATEHGANLIVMGAYGHSKFRQLILGGMTRSMLATSPIPLWMSH